MRALRYLRASVPWRYYCCAHFLLRHVKVHPTAVLNGPLKSFLLCRGVTVGKNARLSARGGHVSLSEGVWLSSDIEMETDQAIEIGARTTIQRRTTINGAVTIGEDCIIAPNVFISSGTHPFREFQDRSIREQERLIIERDGSLSSIHKPIAIGDDCWLGVNVVVCPGVSIGAHCVIGANSVVTRDVASCTVIAGAPAKVIGTRDAPEKPHVY